MGIAPHIARLRAFVGPEQLLLPCATALPLDERGRVLLAWAAGHSEPPTDPSSTVTGAKGEATRSFGILITATGADPR